MTLWLGNIDEQITEADIRGVIYPYGHITGIHLVKASRCAFVDYADRATAEYAAKHMHNALAINGKPISIKWAKSKAQQNPSLPGSYSGQGLMPPPPGLENAPLSSYSSQGPAKRTKLNR